jgi:pimeloyl-ACP methyl ester carboxylesterase
VRPALALVEGVAPDGDLVLVGHSQGGLYTNALARLTGQRIRGVVLLDPAHPDNGRLRRELPPELFRRSRSDLSVGLRMGRTMARLHLMGIVKPLLMRGPPFIYCRQHPRAARDAMWQHMKRPEAYDAALAEYEELEFRTTSADVTTLGAYPPVRMSVLVHDPALMVDDFMTRARLSRPDAERVEELWGSLLRDHGSLSPIATVEAVAGSGHLIHLEKPDVTMARIGELVQATA